MDSSRSPARFHLTGQNPQRTAWSPPSPRLPRTPCRAGRANPSKEAGAGLGPEERAPVRDGGPRAASGTASGLGAPVGQHRAVGQTPRGRSTTPHPKDGDGLPAGVTHLSGTQQSSEEAALPRQGPCSSRGCGPHTGSRRRPIERGPRANLEMRRRRPAKKGPAHL